MIAVDSNILIYAHREDSPWHAAADRKVRALADGRASWAIPWPCLHEFLSISTHPGIYRPPSSPLEACRQVEAWLESPSMALLAETERYWPTLNGLVTKGRVTGGMVHDARIAALCLTHGVTELWSHDRDFGRFPSLKVRNPLV